jgi:nitrogen regulatory protein PII
VEAVKRVEIVVDSLEFQDLVDTLEQLGVPNYTAIKGVFGRGRQGSRGGDPFVSAAFDNTFVLIALEPALVGTVVEAVRPILQRRGGMCLVSDAAAVKR